MPAIALRHMRLLILILTFWTICSCGTKLDESKNDFQVLLSNLKTLENGYIYDIVKQDAEGCYTPDNNADSLFYNPAFPILGQITNGTIHSLIHFEPGDDLYPVIRTFDNAGHLIDSETIVFGNCAGWDCDFDECDEKFQIINQNTIEDIITLVTTPCDSLGNKDPKLTKKEIWKKTITVDDKGKLIVKEEKSAHGESETFDVFLKKFTNDSLFQIERIKFPLTLMYWEDEKDKPTAKKIEISNWRHHKFEYKDEYSKRQVDGYTQETKIYADSAKIELRGIDNGIHVDYVFSKANGRWILTTERDYSD